MTLGVAFGIVVGELCDRRRITQRELATKANLHRNTVGYIVTGDRRATLDSVEAICDALDIEPWRAMRMAAAKIIGSKVPSRLDLVRDPTATMEGVHA